MMKLLGLRTSIQIFGMASTYFSEILAIPKKLNSAYHMVICVLPYSVGRYIVDKMRGKN
jgi:hypothetical protein